MFEALRQWRRKQVLKSSAIPDALWSEAVRSLPFLAIYDADALGRLREKVVLFLDAKGVVGARGHEVTPLQRAIIAIQACVLVLELDLTHYDGFENVIVYPGEFVPDWEWEDDAGVVHKNAGALAGEAMPGGPVVLSWPDVEASADWASSGMNLVIHEFAHKIDMATSGLTASLPASMSAQAWRRTSPPRTTTSCARRPGEKPRSTLTRPRTFGRILCGSVGGFLRRSAVAPQRVSGGLRAVCGVLSAGPGEARRSAPLNFPRPGVL
jgi:hypothetical protein